MPLTNAERQKRHRDRLKVAASTVVGLTAEQIADRDAVMSEPLYPVPSAHARLQMPRFMGWERYEWSAGPEALVDHFGMRAAWDGWQAEQAAMEARTQDLHDRVQARADGIVAACGETAGEILRQGGAVALFRAYEADPTLGVKQKRRRAVT